MGVVRWDAGLESVRIVHHLYSELVFEDNRKSPQIDVHLPDDSVHVLLPQNSALDLSALESSICGMGRFHVGENAREQKKEKMRIVNLAFSENGSRQENRCGCSNLNVLVLGSQYCALNTQTHTHTYLHRRMYISKSVFACLSISSFNFADFRIGSAYIAPDSVRVDEPMDFEFRNRISIDDLQSMMQMLVFPGTLQLL